MARAREGPLGGALVGAGDRWGQWPMGHSLQAPLGRGPSRPRGGSAVGPEVQGSQTGFPTSHVHQLNSGEVQ